MKFSFANHSDQFLGTIYCKVWFDNLFVNDPDHLLGRPIAKKRTASPLITSTFYLSAPKICGSHLYLRAIPCRPLNIPALPHSIARTLPSLRSGITLFRFHNHLRQWIPPIIYSFYNSQAPSPVESTYHQQIVHTNTTILFKHLSQPL